MYELPDESHVSIAFVAMADTIAGIEGLTAAQEYMFGVMSSDGMTYAERIAGSEGFFQSIGAGAKKVWDYIVSMLKNIRDFFFGSTTASAEKKIGVAETKVSDNRRDTGNRFDEAKADAIEEAQVLFTERFKRYVARSKSMLEKEHGLDGKTETGLSKMLEGLRKDFEKSVNNTQHVLNGLHDMSIKTGQDCQKAQDKILELLKCLKADNEMVKHHEQEYNKSIADFQKKIDSTKDALDQMNMEYELKYLSSATRVFVKIAEHITDTIALALKFSDKLRAATK